MNALALDADAVDAALRAVLAEDVEQIAAASPMAARFVSASASVPDDVIRRHLAEHVYRIRGFREIDRKATGLIAARDAGTGEAWASYARSEAVHDRYFLRDLETLGVSRSEVDDGDPFDSTRSLLSFMHESLDVYGALPVVVYSYWAERNSAIGSTPVIELTARRFGTHAVRGATAHHALDSDKDHIRDVVEVLTALVRDEGDLMLAMRLLSEISSLVSAYFDDLDEWWTARL